MSVTEFPRKRIIRRTDPRAPKTNNREPPPDKRFALLKVIGPGMVTGAADGDPSGIGTYSQAGAQLGFTISWTLLLMFPLMVAIQEICARRADDRHRHRGQFTQALPGMAPPGARRDALRCQCHQHWCRSRRDG